MVTVPIFHQYFPGTAPIDAYGNGGFRFAGMSHRGSLLCLPGGVHGWDVTEATNLTVESLAKVLADPARIEALLLGTGPTQVFPSPELRKAFIEADIGLEPMSTGAAARTYNILLAEGRLVAAALIAVD